MIKECHNTLCLVVPSQFRVRLFLSCFQSFIGTRPRPQPASIDAWTPWSVALTDGILG